MRLKRRVRIATAVWILSVVTGIVYARETAGQTVNERLWGTDGNVVAMARSGNTLYIGGAFSTVGPCTGSGVPLSRCTGVERSVYPKVAGEVKSVVADGYGGWFIGGSFTAVGGYTRHNLAHILRNGRVDAWHPDPDGVSVECMTLEGGTLYFGGQFSAVASQPRSNLAAVNAMTGSLTRWDAHLVGQRVSALAVRGHDLFVGGVFSTIGGQSHTCLALVDSRTGLADSVNLDADDWVRTLAISVDRVYVGGGFTHIGGVARSCLAEIDARSKRVADWRPQIGAPDYQYDAGPYVGSIVPDGRSVLVAGHFSTIDGQDRGGVAKFDASSGTLTSWDPQPGPRFTWIAPYITSLAVSDGEVFMGGGFGTLGGQPRNYVGAVSSTTGMVTGWNPRANYYVDALSVQGGFVYAGGRFSSLGAWVERRGLAALDVTTGIATSWNPNPDGLIVYTLAATESVVYIGGDFSNIGGAARGGIAALDPVRGNATTWNPNADGAVATLAVDGQTVYVGGGFSAIGGQTRHYMAALDVQTGAVTPWAPEPSAEVFSIVVDGMRVYAGGFFLGIGGQERHSAAALDKISGAVLPWNPNADNWVNSLAVHGDRVYVGGAFSTIGGKDRQGLAALDSANGDALNWDAGLTPRDRPFCDVFCVATLGNTVFAGGDFGGAAGDPRYGLVALDATTGRATSWNPELDEFAWSLLPYGNLMYVGGRFGRLGGLPRASIAAVQFNMTGGGPADAPQPAPPVIVVQSLSPNPMQDRGDLRCSLSAAIPVSVAIYDVQGRRVATVVNHEWHEAGVVMIPIRTQGLPSGAYLCRIEAAGTMVTRKVLVVK